MKELKGYKYLSLLGKGQATTWLAYSDAHDCEVVVKTLMLKDVLDWKGTELFEREAKVLQELDHPNIPSFVAFLRDEDEGAQRWHLVQKKVEGEILGTTKAWSESDLRSLAKSVLESLVYLQTFSPPLFHRDIKPENLLRREGSFALIDFGSIRHVQPSEQDGSTVVGTSGYMAPEQLMGRASKSSDLYALGMTLIHLLSTKHPMDLETERMKIQWTPYQSELSPHFIDFVNRLCEPHAELRFSNAKEALEELKEDSIPSTDLIRKPKSWVKIDRSKDGQMIKIHGFRLVRSDVRHFFSLIVILLIGASLMLALIYMITGKSIPLGLILIVVLPGILRLVSRYTVEKISASVRITERGLEFEGSLEGLSTHDQTRLDEEVKYLSTGYLESKSGNKKV